MAFDIDAPQLIGPVLSSQYWENLTFLHWPVPVAAVAEFFPPGVRADVFDARTPLGSMIPAPVAEPTTRSEPETFVGLVPFQMRGAGPGRLPVPYFGRFCETNIRLYSVDDAGRHGIVFRTLEAQRLATVLLARAALGLPYAWARMRAEQGDGQVRYRSRRRWPERRGGAGGTIVVRPGPVTEPTALETWLTSRWGLHTQVLGRTVWVPNHHGPWPLHEAALLELDCDLAGACGIDVNPSSLLRPLWTPGVRTRFGRPVLVGRT